MCHVGFIDIDYVKLLEACPSFASSVEESRTAVCPGEKLTYNCSILVANQAPHTVWNGFCADGSAINIFHGLPAQESGTCELFSVQATGSDGSCYTSTLTVTASPDLSGTVMQCSNVAVEVGRASIPVVNGEFKNRPVHSTTISNQFQSGLNVYSRVHTDALLSNPHRNQFD